MLIDGRPASLSHGLGQLIAASFGPRTEEREMIMIEPHTVIGIDVSRDWLDFHSLFDGKRGRFRNTDLGHAQLATLAKGYGATVCFEATGGMEWPLWAHLEAQGVAAFQVPPAQVKWFTKAFGMRAKTDQMDAEMIARFFVFRPTSGRRLPAQKLRDLRALNSKRIQLVDLRRRHLVMMKGQKRQGIDEMFSAQDKDLLALLAAQVRQVEQRISQVIASDQLLARRADLLQSVPGLGDVTTAMLISELPELGEISVEQAAALAGLAPMANESGAFKGKRSIRGGRQTLRHILYQAALVASRFNPRMKLVAQKMKAAGKPHKVVIIAVARKLLGIVASMCKYDRKWDFQPA
ncbi:IS110 family transposase [Falsigemmobacter intermedius]|uniref:IS110 family transposase n=2 Tax=Falsigemmobacter intermedius TaxID=1553448 RepID=A0A451GHB2_9RHOB|nr:IS110 family transposase [Falsigemmobacter intermedius]